MCRNNPITYAPSQACNPNMKCELMPLISLGTGLRRPTAVTKAFPGARGQMSPYSDKIFHLLNSFMGYCVVCTAVTKSRWENIGRIWLPILVKGLKLYVDIFSSLSRKIQCKYAGRTQTKQVFQTHFSHIHLVNCPMED